jgi:Cu(I)/Ag(I) efflux system membrane fusion protein
MMRGTNGRRAAMPAGLALLAALTLAGCQGGGHSAAAGDKPAAAVAARWLCPMHPTYTSDHQGSCPICGMDLVEASTFASAQDGAAGGVPGLAALELDDHAVQLAGVRTQAAAIMPFTRSIRAVGTVNVDQGKLHSVQARVSGWIETLAVDAVGAHVNRGAPLLTIYSPELVATQEELLRARALAAATTDPGAREGAQALADAARRRLKLQGVGEDFIAKLEQSGQAARAVPLASPAGGVVMSRVARVGLAVEPGLELMEIADLSAVWLDARFYEYEARHVRVGQPVTVRLPNDPGASLAGTIDYVYPTLDEGTRTLSARVVLGNDFGQLRPGMYADVLLDVDLGQALVIPDDAILDTGRRQVVFVALGGGRFTPREVTVGERSDGRAQVLSGLEAGEQVVVKAAFLLDSESRIRSALLPPPGEPATGGHDAAGNAAADAGQKK